MAGNASGEPGTALVVGEKGEAYRRDGTAHSMLRVTEGIQKLVTALRSVLCKALLVP